ncbi:hypothetical protein [Nonomuraea sp. NPDC049625]|uniref:hypothetical protein n=1 Tax=Nonomuraea sp. NPDC049625 TaxID=3155775 RepID=UPI00342119D2
MASPPWRVATEVIGLDACRPWEQAHRLVPAGYVQGANPADFASVQAGVRQGPDLVMDKIFKSKTG